MSAIHTTERLFLDTEFIEDGHTIELLSIAVVSLDGREFYAENADADLSRANDWVKANVLPHLDGDGVPRSDIAMALWEWVGASETKRPEFWAYYGDYDWVAVCQLFGKMIDLPKHWPMFCMDVKQLCVSMGDPRLPEQSSTEHHALADARWTRDAYLFLTGERMCDEIDRLRIALGELRADFGRIADIAAQHNASEPVPGGAP